MKNIFARRAVLVLMALLVVGFCFVDASAQRRRTRRSRRVTNPVASRTTEQTNAAADDSTTDPTIVSTADEATENQTGTEAASKPRRTPRTRSSEAAQDGGRGNNTENLSDQVRRLSDKLNQMEEQQRTLVDLERLSRAEQRAENLRAQLRDVQAREADLQARLDVLEEAVKPENIERAMAGYGATHPEDLREQRRKQLENERTRVRAQLEQLGTSRTRLEAAITTADSQVELMRQRVEATPNPAQNSTTPQTNPANSNSTETQPATTTTTSSTPPM